MLTNISYSGWNRIASHLDVELQHGIPVRLSNTDTQQHIDFQLLVKKIHTLTGLSISLNNWINLNANEQEWSVCIDKDQFTEVLNRLALSSAALFVDRFHKTIDQNDVDWDDAIFNYDFNHATEHCCIPYGAMYKDNYYNAYIDIMHDEIVRLVADGVSPIVEPE